MGRLRDRRNWPAPGRLLSVGAHQLHVHDLGEGHPVVVLESGIAASSINWTPVQREIATFTRVCAYDRAGYAWSDRARSPRTPEALVSELRTLLRASGAEPPYILVGHSFGGLVVRLYATMHPQEVAGVVLVDPALLAEWAEPSADRRLMLRRGARLSRRGAWLARVGFVRLVLALAAGGKRALPRRMAAATSGGALSTLERIIGELRKLPPESLPAIRAHWSRPESFLAMAEHFELLPATCSAIARCSHPDSVPLTVISGAHLSAEQRAEHEAIARGSSRGRHIIAERGGHWVHLDEPSVVVDAVRDIFHSYSRSREPGSGVHVA
jgi:pimeloyl-ACP methyl ester carboxylesterase